MSCSLSSGIPNSDRSRWKLTEQTMIRVRINLVQHTQCSNMTSMTHWQESLIRANPGHRIHLALEKLKMISAADPHTAWRTILKDWENKCIVATEQHKGVRKDKLYQPRNTNSLRDTRDNTVHMVFEGGPSEKLHVNMLHASVLYDENCACQTFVLTLDFSINGVLTGSLFKNDDITMDP